MIEPIEEKPKIEVVDSDHDSIDNDEIIKPVTHTIYALADYFNPQTMKVERLLKC